MTTRTASTSKPSPKSKPRRPKDWPTIPPPRERAKAKAKGTVIAASGADAGAAAASRVKVVHLARMVRLVRKVTRCASPAKPSKVPPPTKAKPRKTKAKRAGMVRGEQAANGERRPRRRGRRGGRRRRGNGPEDGLAGSIADELGPTSASEAASAVADFDGGSSVSAPTLTESESEPASQPVEPQPATFVQPETIETVTASTAPAAPTAEEAAPEADRAAAPRRSTVREKVSFLSSAQAEPAPSVSERVAEQIAAPEPDPAAAAPASTAEAPRKAGWWSRRFGSGE